jgi:hypothetical protein
MNLKFNVIRNRPAPRRSHGGSTWRDFFDSLNVGDWFAVTKSDRTRLQSSATTYRTGKYSIYQSDEYPEGYIFLLHTD